MKKREIGLVVIVGNNFFRVTPTGDDKKFTLEVIESPSADNYPKPSEISTDAFCMKFPPSLKVFGPIYFDIQGVAGSGLVGVQQLTHTDPAMGWQVSDGGAIFRGNIRSYLATFPQ
ncbi:MAG: hypothetical protein ABI430_03780 [Candidatus Taylorbacteria bacterium]